MDTISVGEMTHEMNRAAISGVFITCSSAIFDHKWSYIGCHCYTISNGQRCDLPVEIQPKWRPVGPLALPREKLFFMASNHSLFQGSLLHTDFRRPVLEASSGQPFESYFFMNIY